MTTTPTVSRNTCPLWLFRLGKDTFEIAAMLHMTEAEVERRIHAERTAEKKRLAA